MPIFLFLLTLIACSGLCGGIRVNVHVPPYKERGSSVELKCSYNLDSDSVLYSVKWYKGDKQFYAYIPQNKNQKSSFVLPHLNVDLASSNEGSVFLRNLSLKSSGTFRCEVITEKPHFLTEFGEGVMSVIDLPESAPILEGNKHSYQLGEKVVVNCTSLSSKPAATLIWYINDIAVNISQFLKQYPVIIDSSNLETVTLRLAFTASRNHFHEGSLRLKCKAQIGNIFFQSQENVALSSSYLERKHESSSRYSHIFFNSVASTLTATNIQNKILLVVCVLLGMFCVHFS